MKPILTLIFFVSLNALYAQDSLSRFALTSSFYAGVPFQQDAPSGDWYSPDFEIGFSQTFSIRLKNRFFLSLGAGINHQEYRTAPEIRSWTSCSYSPTQGYYSVQYHKDDYARQAYGRFTRIKVPVVMEYMPLGKWTPYARAGFVFDAQIRGRSTEVYSNTSDPIPYDEWSSTYVRSNNFSLGATASGGVKYGNGNVEVLLGLSAQVGLTNFQKYYRSDRVSLLGEVSIRKTIGHEKFPHQRAINVDPTKSGKKNYVYLEGLGSVVWASLNYERALFNFGKNRVHARIGFSAEKSGSVVNKIVPVGLTYIFGLKHGFEAGAEYVQVFGHNHAFIAPHLGYRMEMDNNILLRFTVAGNYQLSSNQFFVLPGASLGYRF